MESIDVEASLLTGAAELEAEGLAGGDEGGALGWHDRQQRADEDRSELGCAAPAAQIFRGSIAPAPRSSDLPAA
jgi:hypothetical protein